jgi:hypothetical protein
MRERIKRNLMATLAFSQGVPMLSHGDEICRTQQGNNNAYCQDNPISWVDWRLTPLKKQFLEFTPRGLCDPGPQPGAATPHVLSPRAGGPGRDEGPGLAAPRRRGDDVRRLERPRGPRPRHAGPGGGHRRSGRARPTPPGRGGAPAGERGRPLPSLRAPRSRPAGAWTEIINTAHPQVRPVRQNLVNLVAHSLMLLRHEAPR